jgi:hypothetical protein
MKITFKGNQHTVNVKAKPIPASQIIPDWWKKIPVYMDGDKKLKLRPYPNVGAKRCFPLLDGITAGYIVPLWCDLQVTIDENNLVAVNWLTNEPVCEVWGLNQSVGYEIPKGYSPSVFKYLHGWVVETPKDYSCLVTHPIGFPNLPFRTLTGVIDTGNLQTFANSPFVIEEGFEGIIEKGTPMFQVIPFKKEKWEMQTETITDQELVNRNERLRTKIISSYGRYMRKNSEYK